MKLSLSVIPVIVVCGCSRHDSASSEVSPDTLETIAVTQLPDSLFIGYPADACFGPSNEILVLDQASCRIYSFTPEGRYTGTFGTCGDGPGEMGNPMSLETVNGLILVRDQVKHGYLIFDSAYRYLETVDFWPRSSPLHFRYDGEDRFTAVRYGILSMDGGYGLFREALVYRTGEAEPVLILYSDTVQVLPEDITTLVRAQEGLLASSDGSGSRFTALTAPDSYEIQVWQGMNPAGTISMEVVPVSRTASEIEREEEFMTSQLNSMGAEGISRWNAPLERDVITGLGCHRGVLWVQTGQGEFPEFNLHSVQTGEFLSTVCFRRTGEWNFRISNDGILAWEEDPQEGYFRIHVLSLSQ